MNIKTEKQLLSEAENKIVQMPEAKKAYDMGYQFSKEKGHVIYPINCPEFMNYLTNANYDNTERSALMISFIRGGNKATDEMFLN